MGSIRSPHQCFCHGTLLQSSRTACAPRSALAIKLAARKLHRNSALGKFWYKNAALQTEVRQPQRFTVRMSFDKPSLQLATAKLPKDTAVDNFSDRLYDWASTMTSSGRNLPFALPLRTRKTQSGFEISLLRISEGEPVAVGSIVASVEDEPQVGNVLYVRFFEGEGASLVRSSPLPEDPQERLKVVISGLVDVPLIMQTMRNAIPQAIAQSK